MERSKVKQMFQSSSHQFVNRSGAFVYSYPHWKKKILIRLKSGLFNVNLGGTCVLHDAIPFEMASPKNKIIPAETTEMMNAICEFSWLNTTGV